MTLSNELLTPIAGENSAGDDLRYDPVYDRIKEARREDLDVPAGEWETTRKTADWPQVVKLATDALTKRTKDVQIAVWLAEALLRRDGFGGFRDGLELLRSLLDQYWENVHPELDEDGDAGLRAAPLAWLGLKLDVAVKLAPITTSGITYVGYVESQSVPTEAEVEEDYEGTKREAREAAVADGKPTPEEFEDAFAATPKEWYRQLVTDLDGCLEQLDLLETFCDERFEDEAPSFRVVQEALEEVSRSARGLFTRKLELEPDPEPVVEAVEGADGEGLIVAEIVEPGASAAGPGVVAARPGGGSAGGIAPSPGSVDDAATLIAAAAKYLRALMPTNPAPYMMLRGFRWGELRANGGTLDPKLLAAPPTDVRVRLKTLSLDRQWDALLEAAEEVMSAPYGRGWLDLQRHVLTACDGLGGAYENVAAGIRGALKSLLEDLPDLPHATLMDDSPTANAETLRWLDTQGLLPDGSAAGAEAPERRPAPSGRERDPRERALDYVRSGVPGKGIELLMQEAGKAKSARARFLRRTEATSIMVDSGLDAVALPILRELAEQIDQYQLEQWEAGDVVAEPLGLLYRCLARTQEDPTTQQDLYLRICRLDPIYAMSLETGGGGGGGWVEEAAPEPAEESGEK